MDRDCPNPDAARSRSQMTVWQHLIRMGPDCNQKCTCDSGIIDIRLFQHKTTLESRKLCTICQHYKKTIINDKQYPRLGGPCIKAPLMDCYHEIDHIIIARRR